MQNGEFEVVIRQGKRRWWQLVLSAAFFTLMLYCLYDNVLSVYFDASEETGVRAAKSLYDRALFFTLGVYNAMENDILIDTGSNLLVTRYRVGPITVSRRTVAPKLEYIAVFSHEPEVYEVNLWYQGNRHFKMYKFEEKAAALALAQKVAARLDLDILDKTVRGESKWIERTAANA